MPAPIDVAAWIATLERTYTTLEQHVRRADANPASAGGDITFFEQEKFPHVQDRA